jgi:hypothetical protein
MELLYIRVKKLVFRPSQTDVLANHTHYRSHHFKNRNKCVLNEGFVCCIGKHSSLNHVMMWNEWSVYKLRMLCNAISTHSCR